MSGHIRKSRFNNNNNNKAVFIYSNKTMQKDFPVYATHGPLNDSYFADEASHTRLIQSPNNQRKEKSRLPCYVAGSASVFPSLPTKVRPARGARGLSTTNSAHEAKETDPLFHTGCSSSDHYSPLSVQRPHAPFVERGPASLARLVLWSHAPSGRASALSANRESGHAFCSST